LEIMILEYTIIISRLYCINKDTIPILIWQELWDIEI